MGNGIFRFPFCLSNLYLYYRNYHVKEMEHETL